MNLSSDCFVKNFFDPILWLSLQKYQKKLSFYLIDQWNVWLVYRAGVNIITYGIQWATLVTHHFFRAHIFWQKCWNQTFSMIIYLLTFYLFDNIEKKLLETLMRIILLLKGNFDKFWKMHVQTERLCFQYLFCARHNSWWSLWQKNAKNNLFIQVKPPILVVEFSNTVTFWINARFNVSSNNQSGFSSQFIL